MPGLFDYSPFCLCVGNRQIKALKHLSFCSDWARRVTLRDNRCMSESLCLVVGILLGRQGVGCHLIIIMLHQVVEIT